MTRKNSTSDKAPTRVTEKSEMSVDRSTLEEKLGFRLRMAERAIFKAFMQQVGMTPVQYSLLTLVATNEGMPQGILGEALNLDRATTMAIMEKLESAGFIERRRSLVDRRRHELHLTAQGRKKVLEAEKQVRKADDQFKQRLSEKELRQFIQFLDRMRGSQH